MYIQCPGHESDSKTNNENVLVDRSEAELIAYTAFLATSLSPSLSPTTEDLSRYYQYPYILPSFQIDLIDVSSMNLK